MNKQAKRGKLKGFQMDFKNSHNAKESFRLEGDLQLHWKLHETNAMTGCSIPYCKERRERTLHSLLFPYP